MQPRPKAVQRGRRAKRGVQREKRFNNRAIAYLFYHIVQFVCQPGGRQTHRQHWKRSAGAQLRNADENIEECRSMLPDQDQHQELHQSTLLLHSN